MKIQNRKFTAGDLARFYGVSGDTIRFYDRKGVLSAKQKEKNDYRIYSRADLISMDHILKLKQGGVPLNDISRIVNQFTVAEALQYFRERNETLQKELQQLKLQIRMNDVFVSTLERISAMQDVITVEMCPALYLKNVKDGVSAAKIWLQKYGMEGGTALAALTEEQSLESAIEWGKDKDRLSDFVDIYLAAMSGSQDMESAGQNLCEGDRIWPSQLCVHAILKADSANENVFYDMERIRNFVEEHHFRLKGSSICWVIYTEHNSGNSCDYYDIWYPIE